MECTFKVFLDHLILVSLREVVLGFMSHFKLLSLLKLTPSYVLFKQLITLVLCTSRCRILQFNIPLLQTMYNRCISFCQFNILTLYFCKIPLLLLLKVFSWNLLIERLNLVLKKWIPRLFDPKLLLFIVFNYSICKFGFNIIKYIFVDMINSLLN